MKIPAKLKAAVDEGRTVFSFEYFPPKSAEGVENLFERLDRMASYQPLFCDITWGAGGSTAELTLDIAKRMQNSVCVETSMHLTCTNMPVEKLDEALDVIKEAGLQNVLALRGDPPHGQEKFTSIEGGYSCALDLVRHIKKKYGDFFGISVAGYPEAHPDAIKDPAGATEAEYQSDLLYLKEKVDAGAEMIVTQLFYDTDVFLKFVDDCKKMGINVPIVPGIMPIMTYGGFKRMTGFCKTKVPQAILDALEPIKDNEEAVRAFGIHQGTEMCRKLLAHGTKALHMYTLNLEKASVSILQNLGLIDNSKVSRPLPWRPATNVKRESEDVRPIHWANRPRSYLARTAEWDKFPAGRWGNVSSPAYGTLAEYQFLRRRNRSQVLAKEWAAPVGSEEDVFQMFAKYCAGDLASNPWSEVIEGGLHKETQKINSRLVALNKAGLLTVNSQPAVNGAPSSDPDVGWGGPGGYVYQKAYVEFFAAPAKLEALLERVKGSPSVSLLAVTASGEVKSSGPGTSEGAGGVNAVTWGVFPGREVVQPTVVDVRSFLVWKDEAFAAWSEEWGALFAEGAERAAAAKEILGKIKDSYYLVSVVENDYVHEDLFSLLEGL